MGRFSFKHWDACCRLFSEVWGLRPLRPEGLCTGGAGAEKWLRPCGFGQFITFTISCWYKTNRPLPRSPRVDVLTAHVPESPITAGKCICHQPHPGKLSLHVKGPKESSRKEPAMTQDALVSAGGRARKSLLFQGESSERAHTSGCPLNTCQGLELCQPHHA